jgi:hypothetical protein
MSGRRFGMVKIAVSELEMRTGDEPHEKVEHAHT